MTIRQHFGHVCIALAVYALVLHLPSPWGAALAAVLVLWMREVTQAEYRWIERNGGLRKLMPWWQGLDVRAWSGHSRAGVLLPLVAVCVVAAWPIIARLAP